MSCCPSVCSGFRGICKPWARRLAARREERHEDQVSGCRAHRDRLLLCHGGRGPPLRRGLRHASGQPRDRFAQPRRRASTTPRAPGLHFGDPRPHRPFRASCRAHGPGGFFDGPIYCHAAHPRPAGHHAGGLAPTSRRWRPSGRTLKRKPPRPGPARGAPVHGRGRGKDRAPGSSSRPCSTTSSFEPAPGVRSDLPGRRATSWARAFLEVRRCNEDGKDFQGWCSRATWAGPDQLLVRDRQPHHQPGRLSVFVESTYGDRNHKDESSIPRGAGPGHRLQPLATARRSIIPAFAVERTQEVHLLPVPAAASDGKPARGHARVPGQPPGHQGHQDIPQVSGSIMDTKLPGHAGRRARTP